MQCAVRCMGSSGGGLSSEQCVMWLEGTGQCAGAGEAIKAIVSNPKLSQIKYELQVLIRYSAGCKALHS